MSRTHGRIGPAAMGGLSAMRNAPSLIRSIQTGTITVGNGGTSATATIAAVVPENTLVFSTFSSQAVYSSNQRNAYARLDLTNATTLTASINFDAGFTTAVVYQVIEFVPGVLKSVQRDTVSVASGASSGTKTILPVDTARALITWLGQTGDSAAVPPSSDPSGQWFSLSLNNTTTVGAARNSAAAINSVVGFQVAEFF